MKSKVGVVCIVLGVLLLAGAGALGLYNMIQDMAARDAAAAAMSQLVEQLQENTANEPTIPEDAIVPGLELQIPVDLLTDEDKKMAEVSDYVICFWDGKSKGTKSMIEFAKQLKKPIRVKMI